MYDSTYNIIREASDKILIFATKMFGLYKKDMDKVHLIYSEIKKFMI